ncbi:hypothetical protein PFICI_00654 [Pestalotiopsis fici W106-1]|uniref:GH16 domain-containing protein n=1 Tax=Pestalotiopsis fici (strain W106-1 / CGMCC3.15140) TaxID=1229662 RepID=W3XNJ4_PESFW|nr:uncharacterized protein PFICI_00654 [Pestalotiopsis fici W106-1]ETS86826.1 hypothetical protein PFICI_00654 [Pestalotiopsis fici W106-1]
MATKMKLWYGVCMTVAVTTSVVSSANTQPQATTDSRCNCYLTNTSSHDVFSSHKFFDFRSMSKYVNVPKPLEDPSLDSLANVTSSYFASQEWKKYWEIQSWNNSASLNDNGTAGNDATVLMVNSLNNVYFEANKDPRASSQSYLTLRTARHDGYQSAAEFDSVSGDYHYLSMRMLARTRGAAGAVTAMFTYRGGGGGGEGAASAVQEADLEIRTGDPSNVIQYTNQPALHNSTGSTRNITLPSHLSWSDWQHHRIDWTPGSSTWFVNGQLVSRITSQAPRDPSRILFNAWSDGGSWSGNMARGSEAYLQIQWIDMVFNNTDTSLGANPAAVRGHCANVCSIDQTRTIGSPVLIASDNGGGQYKA